MGLLVEYTGGLDVEDYHLKYHGNGNGFQVFSNCHNGVINDSSTRVHKGVIELTIESVSRGAMTLGSAERFMLSFEEAEALIERLRDAQEEVVDYEYELVKKECNVG
tara:strand:- start:733 stop:1053 length:321 start_codon:yes stop_codon:yes gene_type:complete